MTTQIPPSPANELQETMAQVRARWQYWTLSRYVGQLLFIWAVGVFGLWFFDSWRPLSGSTRTGLLFSTFSIGVIWFVWKLQHVIWPVSTRKIAAMIETRFPQFQEQLISAIDYCESPAEEGLERKIQQRCIQAVGRNLEKVKLRQVLRPTRSLRVWLVLLGLSTGAGLVLFSISEVRSPWQRILVPWNASLLPSHLEVLEGSRKVARGSDVTIQVRSTSRKPSAPLELHWGSRDSGWQQLPFDFINPHSELHSITMYQVEASFEFWVSSPREETQRYLIEVVDSPEIESARLTVTPPEYTAGQQEIHDGALGNIPVAVQSKVEFQFSANKPIQTAELQFLSENGSVILNTKPFELDADETTARCSLHVERSARFAFHFVDRDGLEFKDSTRRYLEVIGDQPPEIELSRVLLKQHKENATTLVFPVTVRDDYSPAKAELILQQPGQPAQVLKPVSETSLSPQEKEYLIEASLPTTVLQQADQITVRARALDNRDIPRPNETWSEKLSLQSLLPSDRRQDQAERLAQQDEALQKNLATIQEQLKQQQADIEQLKQQTLNQSADESVDQQALNEMIDDQTELSLQLEQVAQDLAQQPLYQELVSPTQQTARNQLPEASQQLKSAAGQKSAEQAAAHMEQAQEQVSKATEQVEQIQSWLNDLVNLKKEVPNLNQLAQQSQALADQLNQSNNQPPGSSGNGENAEQSPGQSGSNNASGDPDAEVSEKNEQAEADRSELQKQAEELAKSMEELLDRNPEITAAAQESQRRALREMSKQLKQMATQQEQLQKSVKSDLHEQQQRKNSEKQSEAESESTKESKQEATPESDLKEQLQQLQQAQQRLARRAASLTMQTVQQSGLQSDEAQKALEMLEQAENAANATQAGDLESAAKSAKQAADKAELMTSSESDSPQPAEQPEQEPAQEDSPRQQKTKQELENLAKQQRDLAKMLEELAPDADARHAARQLGQESLSNSVEQLEQQLQKAAESITDPTSPAAQPELEPGLQRAQHSLSQARQAMNNAESQLANRDYLVARESTRSATQLLQQSSKSLWEVSGNTSGSSSPVPQRFADQIAQAAEQLQAAQKKMSQQQSSRETNSSEAPPEADSQSKAQSNGNDQSGDAEGQEGGQNSASENLEKASESLSKASEELQPGQGQKSGNNSRSGESGEESESGPEAEGGGEGTTQGLKPGQLQSLEELEYFSQRKWGEVSTELKSEIRQSNRYRNKAEYARQIKSYFKEIATPRSLKSNSSGKDSQ